MKIVLNKYASPEESVGKLEYELLWFIVAATQASKDAQRLYESRGDSMEAQRMRGKTEAFESILKKFYEP